MKLLRCVNTAQLSRLFPALPLSLSLSLALVYPHPPLFILCCSVSIVIYLYWLSFVLKQHVHAVICAE